MDNETTSENTTLTFGTVPCEMPVHHIPAILSFLSEADWAFAESHPNIVSETHFGRGAILDLLAQSAQQVVDHIEKVERKMDDLNKVKNDDEQRQAKYTELHGYYQQLIELPENVESSNLIKLKMDISRLENQLSLNGCDALVDFKTGETTER